MEFKNKKEKYHMGMQGILGTQKGNEIISTVTNSKDKNILDVYFGMTHFTSYRRDDSETKKILVGLFGNASVRKVAISEAFSINPCLVTRYSKNMAQNGLSSLLEDRRGRPGKITGDIAVFVKDCYVKLKKDKVKSIRPLIAKKVKDRFKVEISKELIRQITIPVREKNLSQTKLEKNSTIRSPQKDNGTNGEKLKARLKKGFYSRYGAGLVLNVFISRLTKTVLEKYKDLKQAYDLKTFMIMIMQMVQFNIINIERVKRITRSQFGILMGVSKSPGLKTARRKLSNAIETLDTEKISTALAKNYLSNLSCGTDIFYIDDHLDTYCRKVKVLTGFSHIYDRMMEGAQHTFVHDRWGNPICFLLRDNFNNFKELLPVMVKRIKSIYKTKAKLTFVFDRGGYDKKLFSAFGRNLRSHYIVWSKADKVDYSKEDLKFEKVTIKFKRNTKDKPREVTLELAEIARTKKDRMRKIVLRRKTKRRIAKYKNYMYSSLVTNDMDRPAKEVVEAIIYRWREECDFKIEVGQFGIDQITSYSMEDYKKDIFSSDDLLPPDLRQDKMMANPMLRPLRYRKGKIKRDIAKIDEKIGRWTFAQTKKRDRTIAQVAELKRNRTSLVKRESLMGQLKEIEAKMDSLPRYVNRLECLIYGKFKTFNFSKKLIVDTLKVCARNTRKMALEVLDHHYHNYRDQLDFLRRIIENGGYIKLNGSNIVTVEIVPFNTKAENAVLASFLKEINSMKPRMFGDNPYPIKFKVGKA
jgi:hypothetical protein